MKLRPEALIELNRVLINAFEQQVALRHWQGFRVLAVDGSTERLPKADEIQAIYGGPKDADCPIARFSRLYDVLGYSTLIRPAIPRSSGH